MIPTRSAARVSRSLLLAALFAFLAVATIRAAEPVRIGLTLGLTGRYANLATMQQRGYSIWESDVNAKGGLLGRNVELVIIDDESDPQKARQLYEKLIAQDHVDLVFGPYSSSITAAVAPIFEKFGFPVVVGGAAADQIWQHGYENIFGVFTPASRYTVPMLSLALLNDLTTITIMHADDVFSRSVAEGTEKWAAKLGLDVVTRVEFRKDLEDLTGLAQRAEQATADLLIVAGHFDEAVHMRQALKQVGWYPRAYFATVGPVLPKYQETLAADAELTFSSSQWEPHESVRYPGSQAFTATFRELYGTNPSYHAAIAYASGQALEAAIALAGSLEHNEIRDALHRLDTYTLIGRFAVDRTGMQIKHIPLTIQWQSGKKEVVWPEEVRSAEPVFQ